jgi:membrane protein
MLFSAFVLMCAMYRWGPASHVPSVWRAMPGAAISSSLWVVLSYLLSLYTEQMGRLEQTYGSTASIAALLIWLYFSARACVLGAIVNVQLDQGSGAGQALSS